MQASPIPLSNSDARTIRQARQAVALVLNGAIRNLESQYGPADYQDRAAIISELFAQVEASTCVPATTSKREEGGSAMDDIRDMIGKTIVRVHECSPSGDDVLEITFTDGNIICIEAHACMNYGVLKYTDKKHG